jgi:hypothetical protein
MAEMFEDIQPKVLMKSCFNGCGLLSYIFGASDLDFG